MVSFGLSIAGMLVFGALMLLFLARLGWDLKRLQERALAVAKGYRGAPLHGDARGRDRGARALGQPHAAGARRPRGRGRARASQQFHREKMAAVGALAAQVAHEINNPIAVIAGIAEAIGEAPSPSTRGAWPGSRARSRRWLAAAGGGQRLDLNGLVENACAFVRYDARLRRVEARARAGPAPARGPARWATTLRRCS